MFFEITQLITQPEGYVKYNSGTFSYVYQYKDHLGNIRLSYSDSDNNGTINASTEIIEENNYYPFGLKHKGYNNVISSNGNSTAQKFKFQGQELSQDLGYNMYEFILRHYDPALGRFTTPDPYEQFSSPYLAMGNNPVVSFDPDGGHCFDSSGNQIACPEDDMYDESRNSDTNHTTILDEVDLDAKPDNETQNDDPYRDQDGNLKNWYDIDWKNTPEAIEFRRSVRAAMGEAAQVIAEVGLLVAPLPGLGIAANGIARVVKPLVSRALGKVSTNLLLKSASVNSKNGLTAVGRALQKHGSRAGSKFPTATGNPAAVNAQAEQVLSNIIKNPASTRTVRHHARFGKILEIKAPNGQGVRYSADGKKFITFINN